MTTKDKNNKDKVCLIFGATGAIGAAVAQRFYREGASLALTGFSNRPQQHGWLTGGPVLELVADIRQPQQIEAAVQATLDRFGALHAVVNCTGILGPIGPTWAVAADEWIRAVEVNLFGSFHIIRAVLPPMIAQSYGKIVGFSGGGAAYARPFYTAYGSSKAALVRLTESLAEELRESHIDINIIAPGPVFSRMWTQMKSVTDPDDKTLEELRKMEETGGVPPEKAAELAVFLASSRSDGLSGRLISAVWDPWSDLDGRIAEIMGSEAGTLRRVPIG